MDNVVGNGGAAYTGSAGLTDVMYFDASAMTGRANISAAITDLSSPKYFGDTDDVLGAGSQYAPNKGQFGYNFGSANDTLNMVIDGNVAADNDFVMNINMGDGDNSVRTQLDYLGSNKNWVSNQHNLLNLNINTGSGADIVNTFGTGSANISTGAGNDIVYSDNSGIDITSTNVLKGTGAIWVLNAQNTQAALQVAVDNGAIVPIQNAISSHVNPTFSGTVDHSSGNVQLTVEVTFKGVTGTANLSLNVTQNATDAAKGDFSITASQVNQLIINAVNDSNSWLSALMSAQEGAGNSLLMISKVDGAQTVDGLQINFKATYGTANPPDPVALPEATDNLAGPNIDLNEWYNGTETITGVTPSANPVTGGHKQLAQYNNNSLTGADSTAEADNIINLGAGTDLAVLSTGSTSNETIKLIATNNGDNTIINFDLSDVAAGKDTVDASAILGGNPTEVDTTATVTDPLPAGLPTGTTGTNPTVGRSVVFIQNAAATTDANYIANASNLQTLLNNDSDHTNMVNSVVLYMVYDNDTATAATFTMYKATFTNGTASVESCSSLTFADFSYTDGGVTKNNGYSIADFLKGDVDGMFDQTNRLDNGPSAVEPQAWVQVTGTSGTFEASQGYEGTVATFLTGTGISAANLTGSGTQIKLTDAIGDTQVLEDYKTGKTPPVSTIILANDSGNEVDFTGNNALYSWNGANVASAIIFDIDAAGTKYDDTASPATGTLLTGGTGDDRFDIDAAFAGKAEGGNGIDTFNIGNACTGDTVLNGDAGGDIFDITAAYAGQANGGAGNDQFTLDAAGTPANTAIIDGGAGTDELILKTTGAVTVKLDDTTAGSPQYLNFETVTVDQAQGGAATIILTKAASAITVDATKATQATNITTSEAVADTINLKSDGTTTDTITVTKPTADVEFTVTGFKGGASSKDVLNVSALGSSGTSQVATTLADTDYSGKAVVINSASSVANADVALGVITAVTWTSGNVDKDTTFVIGGSEHIYYVIDVKDSYTASTSVAATDLQVIGSVTAVDGTAWVADNVVTA